MNQLSAPHSIQNSHRLTVNSNVGYQYLESFHTCDHGSERPGRILAMEVKQPTVLLRPKQKRRTSIRFGAAEQCLYLVAMLISLV